MLQAVAGKVAAQPKQQRRKGLEGTRERTADERLEKFSRLELS